MKNRLVVILFALSLFFVIPRAFRLQVLEWHNHRIYVESLRTRLINVPAPRGTIFSSDMVPLAWDREVYVLDPWGNDVEVMERSGVLSKEEIKRLLSGEKVVLDKNRAELLEKLGVRVTVDYERNYAGLAPHVLGYVNIDREGMGGVERFYNDHLKGKEGVKMVFIEPTGKVTAEVLKAPPQTGRDLVLTIDSRLQRKAEEILKTEKKAGVIILSNIKTGEILAMASYPDFNPQDFSRGFSRRDWNRINNDPQSVLLNRAISSIYPPGSSIKVFWALVALLSGYNPKEIRYCSGAFHLKNSRGEVVATYKDWDIAGHGSVDLREALRVSCNVYFYQLGLSLGISRMSDMARAFKIFDRTGIDLPGERAGYLGDPSWKVERMREPWFPGDTVQVSIGQGYIGVTPIGMLRLISLVANKGVFFKPRVVKMIGRTEIAPKVETKVEIDDEIWNFLTKAMEDVTSFPGSADSGPGTAYSAFRGFKYRVAGKTGTAETGRGEPHSWFVGFAPVNDPEVGIVVIFEHGGFGSGVAAHTARKMLEEYFRLKESASGTP